MPAVSLPCEPASFRKQVEYPAYLHECQIIYDQNNYHASIKDTQNEAINYPPDWQFSRVNPIAQMISTQWLLGCGYKVFVFSITSYLADARNVHELVFKYYSLSLSIHQTMCVHQTNSN
jgi:hypothetical protein